MAGGEIVDWNDVLTCFPQQLRKAILPFADELHEIRVRADKPLELSCGLRRFFTDAVVDGDTLRAITLNMMEHSYYTRENELSRGFFTMGTGWRVGVCGSFVRRTDGSVSLQSIGSICIRVAREVYGCAEKLVDEIMHSGAPESTLIISRPGMGKTTMLRDAARLLSERGQTVAIADERHELAACRDGIPVLNVGRRTDVIDGCDKQTAMRMLIRTMAPRVIVADEIGNAGDIQEVRYAARRGVAVLTSAHAASMADLKQGELRELLEANVFAIVALLDGVPGRIERIWRF